MNLRHRQDCCRCWVSEAGDAPWQELKCRCLQGNVLRMVFHRISLARAHNNNPNYWIIVHGARCPSWICQRCHARFKPFREPKRRLQAQDFMTIPSCLECQPWTTTLGLVNCEGTGYLSRTADESRVDFICVYIYNCWRVQGWFYMYIYI